MASCTHCSGIGLISEREVCGACKGLGHDSVTETSAPSIESVTESTPKKKKK